MGLSTGVPHAPSQRGFPAPSQAVTCTHQFQDFSLWGGLSHPVSPVLPERAETTKTQSSRTFPSVSAELPNPLCPLQETYLLSIREAGGAALEAQALQLG